MAIKRNQRTAAPSRVVVTSDQLRDAERGLRLILARTHTPAWITQNAREVLAEANRDYVLFVREHGPARNPPGWLIDRACLRASNLTRREVHRRGPPLDSVIQTVEDAEPTPEQTALEADRRQRIEDALSEIPESERRLIRLVYFEDCSIREAGRRLGWGKSNADEHHAKALNKMKALIGPRDAITPGLLGLLAKESLDPNRGRLAGRIANRLSAAVQDLADLVARALGSTTRNVGDVIRRAMPIADSGTAAATGSGAGRVIAQCGALAAICSAVIASSSPVEQLIQPQEPGRLHTHGSSGRISSQATSPPDTGQLTEVPTRSSAAARSEEARRIERGRRRARVRQARRARKAKERKRARAARAQRERRSERTEAAAEAAPEEAEPAPAPEAVEPEVEASPPPATGRQTREEFGF